LEEHVTLAGGERRLAGILHAPGSAPRGWAVLVHGWTGCKLGPHRMFVKLARRLESSGWACLRFDLRGRGDSEGEEASAGLGGMVADTRTAFLHMRDRFPGCPGILLGICSGANVCVGALSEEPRPDGLVLWSMPTYGSQAQARQGLVKTGSVLGTYWNKAKRLETWKKALRGRLQPRMIAKAVLSPLKDRTGRDGRGGEEPEDEATLDRKYLDALSRYEGPLFFVYGTADPMASRGRKAFEEICLERPGESRFEEVEGANHSFYALDQEAELLERTMDWIQSRWT